MSGDDGETNDDSPANGPGGSDADGTGGRDRPETLADDVDETRDVDDSPDDTGGNQPSTGTDSGGHQPSTGTGSGGGQPTTGTGTGGSQPDSTPSVGTSQGGTTAQSDVETSVSREDGDDGKRLLAALVSFFLPGVGNMITGQTERGLIILVVWIAWLVVGWGLIVFLLGSIITLVTLGFGVIVWILLGLVASVVEFAIHVIAAIDAYQQSKIVDNVTVKVNQVRGN